ncbi:MAG: hypothetical protein FWC39_12780 [Bacteroidetes bacterium]|nr:hypothetical protein [Bacteroidota bacterium]
MNAYKFNTRVSSTGTITLPYNSHLYDTDVEVFVVSANSKETIKPKRFSANDFIKKWQGSIKGMETITDEELEHIKHERLKQKYV